jgi:hypothetical protein
MVRLNRTFGVLDPYIHDAVILKRDFMLACPNEISRICRSDSGVGESGDFVEHVNRCPRIENGQSFNGILIHGEGSLVRQLPDEDG